MAKPKIYIDACCLIESVKGDLGLSDASRNSDLDMLRRLLKAARDGEMVAYTSLLTVAEVIKAQPGDSPIDDSTKKKIERLILSGQDGLTVVGLYPTVVMRARDLAWDLGMWTVKPFDRVHLASAAVAGAKEFLSWDNRLGKKLGQSDLKGMRLIAPSGTTLLPTEYRANDLFAKKK